MTTQTRIITGASRGLGRALAEAARAAGDCVMSAVRHPETMAALHTGGLHGDRLLTAAFDVCDTGAAPALVQAALDRIGRLDVLVDNAGRAIVGSAHTAEVPLGREAVERLSGAYRRAAAEVERWAETARSADYPGLAPSVQPV
ncbi:SDR family NAD(P)-dependent oxidoreductase [Nonomuraea typhae]|uniref:SDR family NAD(P)-dependent oxidoreductase n=1 Tax=Nonomuraea typhae TaxID=2603600 RepID=A0ABW7Z5Z3_9ACTN